MSDYGELLELAESAVSLLEAIDAPTIGGLRHPKHAKHLKPIRAKAERVLRGLFKRQGKLVLGAIKPKLREAEGEAKDKAASIIPTELPLSVTGAASYDYGKALGAAIEAGYANLADEMGSDSALAEDVVQEFLAKHSLTKLTGGLDETTVDRLRNALADAYNSGADYEGLLQAVKDEYSGFSTVRAGMIAQTEMNAAYNAGRKQLGLDMGFNEKSWDPDGTACVEVCIPNVLAGWIPMDEEFPSGDDIAPGHPNCDCSLNIRYNQGA